MTLTSRVFRRRIAGRSVTSLLLLMIAVQPAIAQEKLTFQTNWLAQAEHGGYYQALATGLYKQAGLDVTIKQGGAQANHMQMLAAGQLDCIMGASDALILRAHEQGIPAVVVATVFQKDPQGLAAHSDVKAMEDLKSRTIMINTSAHTNFWPWLKKKFGFNDAQTRPYSFSLQPFITDKNVAVQAYLTYDPYAIESQTGEKPAFFLFADYGWSNYSLTIVCMEKTIKERPQAVAAFVKASMQGWKSYLTGDPSPANALIKKENPNMTDAQMAYTRSVEKDLIMGGDAATMGIGIITAERFKKTFDMLVDLKLVDPSKIDLKKTYDLQFVKDLKIMP